MKKHCPVCKLNCLNGDTVFSKKGCPQLDNTQTRLKQISMIGVNYTIDTCPGFLPDVIYDQTILKIFGDSLVPTVRRAMILT